MTHRGSRGEGYQGAMRSRFLSLHSHSHGSEWGFLLNIGLGQLEQHARNNVLRPFKSRAQEHPGSCPHRRIAIAPQHLTGAQKRNK